MQTYTVRLSTMLIPPICVACGEPAGPVTLPVGTSDWNGKHMITIRFPLCVECGEAREAGTGLLGGLSKRKLMRNDPARLDRFDAMAHAIKLKGYKPTAFRSKTSDAITVEIANPRFAEVFAMLNGVGPVVMAGPGGPEPASPGTEEAPSPPARPDALAGATPARPDR